MGELAFEDDLIQYLCRETAPSSSAEGSNSPWGMVKERTVDYVVRTKRWKYEPGIKTTEQLWDNFKRILERHNQDTLEHPLSVIEFNQSQARHFRFRNAL